MYGQGQGQARNNQPMGYPAPGQHPANPQGGYQQPHQQHEGFPQQGPHPPAHQYPAHEMQNNGAAPQQYAQHQGQMLKPPASLMQPPALNVEENMNTNSQFLPQRQTQMAVSNNENSEQDNYPQQQQGWNNQEHIAAAFWQQKCYEMLGKFEWFFDRFEILRNEYSTLSEEIQKMDTEEDWHMFQQHHDQFHEKIVQLEEELSALMGENEQMYQQKMAHDGENMWEQRYQELLGNFKSLQEEMSQMEAGEGRPGVNGGVPPEQYQHLEDQFNELHYQYNEVVNELQKQPGANYQEEFEMQINEYQNEIEQYKMNLDSLHHENVELQNMIVDLEGRTKDMGDNYDRSVDKSKFEELIQLIEQKEMEIQALQIDFQKRSNNQGAISQYEAALVEKNQENEELRRIVDQKEVELAKERKRIEEIEPELNKKLSQSFEGEKVENERRVKDLERNIADLNKTHKRNSQNGSKAEALEKKLSLVNQEVTSLSDSLKKKNKELTELRESNYELEKLKEIEGEYRKIVMERDRLVDNLKRKNGDLEASHHENETLTAKIQEISNKRQEYSTRNLMAEIEDLNEHIRRNEGEVMKLKNIIELKEDYCLKTEEDLKKLNDKYIMTEQALLSERDIWREKEVRMSSKNMEHQKRMKNLDYEFNLQLKDTLEKEVTVLRRQNVEKQDVIRNMEENEFLLSSKLAIFQKQKSNFNSDVSLMKKKEQELETLNLAQSRRFKELEVVYLAIEEELDDLKQTHVALNSDLSHEKSQKEELSSLLKTKKRANEDFQRQIAEHLGKNQILDRLRVENTKLKIAMNTSHEELEKIKLQTESRVSQNNKLFSAAAPMEKQDNVVITQLEKENQYLKQEMCKMVQKMTVSNRVSQKIISHQSIDLQEKKSSTSTVNLNKRLGEFNSKLQFAIGQENNELHHSKSQEQVSNWEKEKKNLVDRYESQIRELRDQIGNNGVSQVSENGIFDNGNRRSYAGFETEKPKEEVRFYKKKSQELEDRNQTLIKINEDLKEKINSILTIRQTKATSQFFKQQNNQLEGENEVLKTKLKKSFEENKEYRIELSVKNSKVAQEYEYKILELELSVQDLKRKITYFQTEKIPKAEEKVNYSGHLNNSILDASVRGIDNVKRSSYKTGGNEITKKYGGIQEEFQSVLGNLKGSPRGQGISQKSVNYGSHYSNSILDEYQR